MSSSLAVAAVFLAGAWLLIAAVRWWRRDLEWSVAACHLALVCAFFFQPLFGGRIQLPLDIAYARLPFSDSVPNEVSPLNAARADTLLEQLPFHTLGRNRLLAGEAPLWAHEIGTGQPLLGNSQSAPFAPLHLLALPLPPMRGLAVAAAWEILVGLLLMHALLQRLGAGRVGAAFGAIAAGLSVYAIGWSYDTLGMAAAWVPGVLLGILMTRDREPRGIAGLVVCALAVALGGHPETTAQVALLAVSVAGAALLSLPNGRLAFVGRLGSAATLAALLAAPVVLPAFETLTESARWHGAQRAGREDQTPAFSTDSLLPTFSPLAFGNPRDDNYQRDLGFNELCSSYAGLLTLALALAGALATAPEVADPSARRVSRRVSLIVLGGAGALLVALRVPPLFQMVSALPVIGAAKQGRLRLFWVLALAAAAGLVLERVANERRLRTLACALIALGATALALVPPPPGAPWQQAWWIAALAGSLAALTTLIASRWRPWFARVALAGLILDLFLLNVRYQPVMPARIDLSPPPALSFLVEQSRASPTPFRVLPSRALLPSNLNAVFDLWDPRGNDPMRPERAARVLAWRLGHQRRFFEIVEASPGIRDQGFQDYLGVRFALTGHDEELPTPWRLAFEGAGGRVWQNPQAMPLFFVPDTMHFYEQPDAALQAALELQDFRADGIAAGTGAAHQEGRVRQVRPTSNGFDMTVESTNGAIVVSSVSYAADWVARSGEREWPARLVNSGFLGFDVPAGNHFVRLRYRPRSWTLGLLLFGVGLLGSGLLWAAKRSELPAFAWL